MELKEFMTMFTGGENCLHIRNIHPVTKQTRESWVNPTQYTNSDLYEVFLRKNIEDGFNVYFQVSAVKNGSKASLKNYVIWADADLYKYSGGESQVVAALSRLPKPSMIVHSGGGWHIYWRLNAPVEPAVASQISKYCNWMLAADAVHNHNRLMRLPNTVNFKAGDRKPVKIIQENDVSYGVTDFKVDETLLKVPHSLISKVILGPDSSSVDRSEYDFGIVMELLKDGFTEQEVSHILRHYHCSGKVHTDRSHSEHYISVTVKNAIQRTPLQIRPTSVKNPAVWVGKSLKQILEEEKPPFIVNDFLPNAGVAMIAAPPKARKSWCVMQLAQAVATGTEWLGFQVPSAKKVLYVQAELPNWMVAERMLQMYGDVTLDNLQFFHIPAANLLDEGDLQGLITAVNEFAAELVIIDPIANFWQGDENSSSSVNLLFDQIAQIQALGCAVVLVHHSRKTEFNERLSPQHQRGSNVFFARPAAVMTLSPILIVGETPYTWADFALRAAATPEPKKLYTDDTGKFTVEPPGLTLSPVKQMLLNRQQKDVIAYGK